MDAMECVRVGTKLIPQLSSGGMAEMDCFAESDEMECFVAGGLSQHSRLDSTLTCCTFHSSLTSCT